MMVKLCVCVTCLRMHVVEGSFLSYSSGYRIFVYLLYIVDCYVILLRNYFQMLKQGKKSYI